MTVEAVVAIVGCLLLIALAYLVGRLQGEVRRLKARADVPVAPVVGPPQPLSRVERIDVPVITALSSPVDEPDPGVSRVATVTLARPLVKVAAFSYGLRRALDDERRFRVRSAMRVELKRQRKMRRRRRAGWAPSNRWRR
jgi:hypothetical protein